MGATKSREEVMDQWLDELRTLLFSVDKPLSASVDRAMQLKSEAAPKRFFKYRRCGPRQFDALSTDYLHFASIDTFNDPFDSVASILYERGKADDIAAARSHLLARGEELASAPAPTAGSLREQAIGPMRD